MMFKFVIMNCCNNNNNNHNNNNDDDDDDDDENENDKFITIIALSGSLSKYHNCIYSLA